MAKQSKIKKNELGNWYNQIHIKPLTPKGKKDKYN